MLELVDTHCHIQTAGIADGLWQKQPSLTPSQLIKTAQQADVKQLICVGCTLEDSRLAVELAVQQLNCYASIGIHPHEAEDYINQPDKWQDFEDLLASPKVVAIGEAGLDYFYNLSPKVNQLAILRLQMELAVKHNLPMIFHVREAFDDFWPIFDEFKGLRGVLHSFTAKKAVLEAALQRGLYIGLNGIMTFTKQPDQLDMAKAVPLSKLLLETDAPFLTPTPFRGTICEPKHVRVTAEFLSQLRGESLQQLATATTQNSRSLFKLTT